MQMGGGGGTYNVDMGAGGGGGSEGKENDRQEILKNYLRWFTESF